MADLTTQDLARLREANLVTFADLSDALAEIERLREEHDGLRSRILGLAEAYETRARDLYSRPEIACTSARAGDAEDTAVRIRGCL